MFDGAFGAAFEQLTSSDCTFDDSFDSSFDVCSVGEASTDSHPPRRVVRRLFDPDDEELLWIT